MFTLIRAAAALTLMLCVLPAYSSIGSWIEPNMGQTEAAVRAIARDGELAMLLESHRVRLLLPYSKSVAVGDDEEPVTTRGARLLELVVEGAAKQAAIEFGPTMTGVSRYFRGADDSAWLNEVTHHQSVRFVDVYPGIDLVYRLRDSRIEYDFLVDAGADPGQIALELRGAERVALDDGDLVATTKSAEIRQHKPEVFHVVDGRLQPVAGRFRHDGNRFGFAVAGDDTHDIVIDPVIEFSTYLGGSADDNGSDIAVNNRGNLIVNGMTMSLDIPGAPGGYTLGGQDIFIAEIDRDSSQLLWISFIGGSGVDVSDALTVDSQGNVIAVGYTDSPDFPTVNAFQATLVGSELGPDFGGNWDGHVIKLSDDGSQIVFSTYYGGLDWDFVSVEKFGFEFLRGVEVDAQDHIHVVGQTGAPDFPVTSNFRNRSCMETDAFSVNPFVTDIVLIEFAPDGTRQFATCIGGTERDAGRQLAFGPGGATYVGGFGRSSDLPVSLNAFQAVPPGFGIYTPFVLKLNSARTDIEWGTYFGGSDVDLAQEFAVGGDGSVYAVGWTGSADFPVTPDALQPAINAGAATGSDDGFVVKMRADGTALDYATFFGGGGDDYATAMRIDDAGRIYFAGEARSRDLLLRTPLQSEPGNLYSNPRAIAANGPINAMAIADFGPFASAEVVMARDGVNQYARRITGTSQEILDIGAATANDTRDLVVGDFSSSFSAGDVVFIEAGAANRVYLYDDIDDTHMLDRTFGDPGRDSRAVAPLPLGGGNSTDVVVANYGEANEIFIDAVGAPMSLGRVAGNTVDVVTGSFGGFQLQADIIFANEGQDVRLYRSIGNMLYSSPILLSAVSPNASVLATIDIDGDFTTDLVIGNSSGPLQIVRGLDGLIGPVEEIPGSSADTRALLFGDVDSDTDFDLFVGNNGPDRLYLNDGNGNFTPSDEFPEIDSLTLALAEEAFCTECEPYVGGPAGLSQNRQNDGDLMIAVIDADAGTLEFSTYLEGNGTERVIRGLTFDSDGDILIAASTDGNAWPEVGAVQAGPGGGNDAVFFEIDVDIDDDGVLDGSDNCLEVPNPAQRDTDNDAYGNFCDPDLNNDEAVNFADLQLFKDRFFGTDPDADLDGDGSVNFADLQLLKNLFFGAPGPSGLLLP